ncbi:MAG: mechanosensitive ion channel family protein [Nocardioides sp.]
MTATWTEFAITLGSAVAAALVLLVVVHLLARALARRWLTATSLVNHTRRPFRWFVMVATVAGVVSTTWPADVPAGWWDGLRLVLRITVIGFGAWLLAAVLLFLEDLGLRRYRVDVADNRAARRARTQVLLVRRLTVVVVVVLALGMALLSLPGVQAVGASVLASAGVVSIIAAVAAQPTLGNVVAGLQIAFSDALRLDDIVVVEQEWGRIEEITLSYVVVRVWDDRRLVLPTTYFTRTPFENWTRSSSELLGGVEVDVDWRTDLAAMRDELDRILAGTDLWDERTKVLQVTEATGGLVRARVLVSAHDAGDLWDLRCLVRERLVAWLREQDAEGLPRQRVELVEARRHAPRATGGEDDQSQRLFSGDVEGERRGAQFRQPSGEE